jgi:putative MATE family efflux protein
LIVVGKFCGSVSVGAVGATGSLTSLLVNLFIGLSVGAGVSVAHSIGSKDEEQIRNTVHTAVPLALICGVALTVIGVLFSEPMLVLMGTPENTLPLSAVYMKIYFGGITFNIVYNFCASILRAAGDTRSPLIFLTSAGVVNVILNVIFVTIFHMNVAGVALATMLSQGIAATLVVRALMRRTDACKLELRKLCIRKNQLLRILRIGLPAGIQSSLFAISNVIIQSSINSFGDIFVSGNAAAGNLEGFMYATVNSFHQTTVNYVGQNVGARQYRRANNTVWICQSCVLVVGLAMGTALWGFGETLLGIYITDSLQAIQYGMIRLTYVTLPYVMLGLMDVSTGALRGYGKSLTPMIISVLGICGIRVLWVSTVFQIPAFHTPQWLYISYPISWFVTLVVQTIFFLRIRNQYIQKDGIGM